MHDDTNNNGAAIAAQASYQVARDALGLDTRQAGRVSAVAAGLIDLLVDKAQTGAALGAVSVGLSAGARDAWAGLLESLQACDLSPVIYCTKTGRALGVVSPEPWADYLHHLATLGDCAGADAIAGRLLSAIIAQKSQAVAPVVLHSAGDALAVVRRVSPADFLVRALSIYVFPMGSRADSLQHAQRAERLGAGRAALSAMPAGAVSYACEVVSLLLSYVDLRRAALPELSRYGSGAAVDFAALFASPATVGHFCGRIVQGLVKLLAGKRLRPVNTLSPRDLLALRVDWGGVPEFAALRQARRALSATEAGARKRYEATGGRRVDLSARQAALMATDSGRALFDAIDLSLILGASGRKVAVAVDMPDHASAALDRKESLAALRAESLDDSGDGLSDFGAFDVADLIAGGYLPAGVLTSSDDGQEDFALEFGGVLETALAALSDDDDSAGGLDDLGGLDLSGAMQSARPVQRLPRAPSLPRALSKAGADAATVSALLAALDDPAPSKPAARPLSGMFAKPVKPAPATTAKPLAAVIKFPRVGAPKP